jgi:hypothetical protein
MHTVIVIGLGLCLLGLCLLVGRFLIGRLRIGPGVGSGSDVLARAALAFVPLWLIGAALNMWIGVARAGYSLAEEAPIFLIVFGVPAASALLLRWRLASAARRSRVSLRAARFDD